MLDFLKLVLPTKGHYCWVTIKDKRAKQGFVPTIEELAKVLTEKDAQGIDTYFACASYLKPTKRTHDNVDCVKAFWLDIDAGPGKPYVDADAAMQALDGFCNKSGLPFATVICSGNGVHAWWPLTENIEHKTWKQYAEQFKSICNANSLHADSVRTADVSSILRAPQTRNFKRTPSLPVFQVEFEEAPGSYSLGDLFSKKLDIVRDWNKIKEQEDDLSLTKGYGDGYRTQELVRRAGHLLGPAKSLSEQEAIRLLHTWNSYNTPPLDSSKIESTVRSIGRSESNKRESAKVIQGTLPGSNGGGSSELPVLPFGYKWSTSGRLTTQVPGKDEVSGEEIFETVDITEFPLYLLSVTRKEREFKQSYVFCQYVPKEGWREFQITCSEFESTSWKSVMAENGGHCVLQDKLFKNYVHKADSDYRREKMDAIRYQQFGWKDSDSAFLVGDTLIKTDGKVDRVYGGEEISHRMKQMLPRKGGSLNAWTQDANLLFSDQYIHLGYALVASFATSLLKFCMGESDGGFVLSITSPGSGKGKTRTIEACTSVWGELESLQITPRDTLNAQMAIVTSACHLPVFMDEWNEKDPGVQAKFLRQLTVGHDKNRAQRDGTVKSKPATYKTLLITTSNHSIYDIMNMINDEAAAARVVEIVAPDLDGDVFKKFDKITGRMLANSGYAGREFIYQLMQPGVLENVKLELTTAIEKIREYLHTQGRHRYITVLPAAVLVTANLLVKHGILEFDVARLIKWSFEHVANRIHTITETPASEILGLFLAENMGKILRVSGPYVTGHPVMVLNALGTIPQAVIARAERDSHKLYIMPSVFKLWCMKNGNDFSRIAESLTSDGVLVDKRKFITLGAGTEAPLGRTTCWELNMQLESMGGDITPETVPDSQ